jgi:hypothetical protein
MALHPKVQPGHNQPIEDEFRYEVRVALGLDSFAQDHHIVDEIKRLKYVENEKSAGIINVVQIDGKEVARSLPRLIPRTTGKP